jgi:hypothetical protein
MNRIVRLALVALPLMGCRDIHAPDTTSPHRLEIIPPRAISPKEQYTLQLTAYTYSGLPLSPPVGISWSSSDASVATVDASGTVTGLTLGYTTIKATAGGLTAYTNVQVRPTGLRITMTPAILAVGDTGIVSVARLDYNGDVIESDKSGAWWEWNDTDIVEFLPRTPGQAENQLVVVGKTPGSLFIWADGVGVSGGFWITVVESTASR